MIITSTIYLIIIYTLFIFVFYFLILYYIFEYITISFFVLYVNFMYQENGDPRLGLAPSIDF